MEVGIQKTIVFLFFIFIGVLLKVKFKSKEEITGIKKVILNLALPATIFIALLGVKVELHLLILPLLALGLNLLLFFAMPLILPLMGIGKGTSEFRTAKLLVPSLAPGLSSFPFILEFLGEEYLAKAAMSDLGNKVFVLFFLYLVAMNCHYNLQSTQKKNGGTKLKSLIKAMVSEPVNIFIGAALVLLVFGVSMNSLPFFLSETLEKLSLIMTPLVLLFIGLAVKIKRKQFFQIFSLLCIRAGLVLLISGIFMTVTGIEARNEILLTIAFGLSACSFWPYAHIAAVDSMEMDKKSKNKTFSSDFGVAILALSFPLSTILILATLNSGSFFMNPLNIFMMGVVLITVGFVIPLISGVSKKKWSEQKLINHEINSASTEKAA
ncbi:permease [Flagellimonas halotolerans]|uniref:Permease n=1 Tax=Flagellimonas halotolerans TaxID=3112164 RepID=A0ABU6ITN4_9FLAO|nr:MULTISPECIES: permease [unclassified Allomuricauda]MEC3966691.1 permease [Muricauda sp. SYSU M86414]MEC4266503.1 permease [Muricauda sp. SYSU M84420]